MNTTLLSRFSHTAVATTVDALDRASGWCAAHFARAPATSTGVVLMVLAYALATGNALYGQSGHHPAPLFGATQSAQGLEEVPMPPPAPERSGSAAVPAEAASAPVPAPQTQTAVSPSPASAPSADAGATATAVSIGNPAMARLQEKLLAMGLFEGTVDGYYGPRTADAIRAFEERFGMPRTGAASAEVLEAVENAPIDASRTEAAVNGSEEETRVADQPVTLGAPPAPLSVPAPPEGNLAPPQPGVDIAALIQDEGALVATAGPGAFSEPSAPERALEQLAAAPDREEIEDGPSAQPNVFESLMALASRQHVPAQTQPPSLDTDLIRSVQTGLAQLGFLRGPVTGVADDGTARAIRSFEIFHNFEPSGTVSYALLDRLSAAGAEV